MKHLMILAASAAGLALVAPAKAADPEFMVLDWAGFEIDGLFAEYAAKHGTGPTYTFFGDDDEAFQKVASGFKTDVVHPCSQVIQKYRDAGLIEPWDESRLPAVADIAPQFLDSPVFKDDQGLWFVPTDYGVTAVAYNTEQVPPEDVASLQVFADPKYAGRISLPDNTDDVWSLAYLATGVTNWSNVTDEQYQAAADWIRAVHPNVRAYWTDPGELAQLMASGEVLISWTWPDAVTILQGDNFPVAYTRAMTEGSVEWFCGYVNMKDAPGSEDKAYDFMNSWLRPDAAPALFEAIGYGHTTAAGKAAVGEEALNAAGLGAVTNPVLAQTPLDIAKREQMVKDFETIKAGF
jgi:spermidine/putrescine transport system substrate-binding protein